MAIKCIQANLHHAVAASNMLCCKFAEDSITMALLQEPWIRNGTIKGLNINGCKLIYDGSSPNPRSAIVIKTNVNFLCLTEFTTADLVSVLLSIDTTGGVRQVVFASAYFPGDDPDAPPGKVCQLIQHCKNKNIQYIIGCDANAHHTVWGSSNVNNRGKFLFDYLCANDVEILNNGCKPTFINSVREEVLDLTLSSRYISNYISNWRVSDEVSCSDHQHIFFQVDVESPLQTRNFNHRYTDWNQYKNFVALESVSFVSHIRSATDLEIANNTLSEVLNSAVSLSTTKRIQQGPRKVPWWTQSLEVKRKTVRKLYNKAKKSRIWDEYRAALTEYNSEMRQSKRDSWRKYCESIENLPAAARLHKALSKNHSNGLGTLRTPSNTFTNNSEETLGLLLQTHFPGCCIGSIAESQSVTSSQNSWVTNRVFSRSGVIFDKQKVRWAVNSFKPFKSPGCDGIIPAMIQQSLETILDPLIDLFRASYCLSYIPKAWRKVRVVFIPKLGKPSETPKSYRPISLTSTLLKVMERLIELDIREAIGKSLPIHKNQYAYMTGKSTESALHELVSGIEKSFHYKETTLCAFLDVEGAFDNTSYESITKALIKRKVHDKSIAWINSMLRGRIITSSLGQSEVTVRAVKGCPQGGVLSPLLWSLVVDELLHILSNNGFKVIGYADDLVIIVTGKFDSSLSERMNTGLSLVRDWCSMENLSVNPNKTVIVPFSRKHKLSLPPIRLGGTVVGLSNQVKYLGITLDQKLLWTPHIDSIVLKGTKALWACKSMHGKQWGMSPQMGKWIFTAIVRPIITYGAVIWWTATRKKTVIAKLNRLQRAACLLISSAMKTCPTAAIEYAVGLTPLHIFIRKVATTTCFRLKLSSNSSPIIQGHLNIMNSVPEAVLLLKQSDAIIRNLHFDRRFTVTIPDRDNWCQNVPAKSGHLDWYTDGSKTDSGVGAGIYGPNTTASIAMGRWPTVFQAEVYAISVCATLILSKGLKGAKIRIFSDSQAALKSLSCYSFTSKLALECFLNLQSLSLYNKVHLIWVPGHEGHVGNERADELARQGSCSPLIGPEPFIGISWSHIKYKVKSIEDADTKIYWDNMPGMRQAKILCRSISKELKFLKREDVRLLVGFLTGHCSVNYHLHKIGLNDTPICRFCLEEDETAEHILCECPALSRSRLRILHKSSLTSGELQVCPTVDILRFIRLDSVRLS